MGKKGEKQQADEELQTTPDAEPVEPSQEEAEDLTLEEQLRFELQQAQDQARSNQDLYVRTLAEMENLRKRTQREKEELAKFANENILRDILPVIDNLERALEHAEQAHSTEGLVEGVQMTLSQFSQVLKKFGVEPVDALGQPFDPALHQAMGQLETTDYPANAVAQEMLKGYVLNERLLRPAMVMIAKPPVADEGDSSAEDQD